MIHRLAAALLLVAGATMASLVGLPAPAAAEIALRLPPPDVVGLVPLAALPADKPAVPVPPVAPPPAPVSLPELPTAKVVSDPRWRPVAPMPSPRILACNPVGTVFKVASELVECGRARYQRGELEAARSAFTSATQETRERELLREARYWLGETLVRLGRPTEAERVLTLVVQDDPASDLGLFATHTLGWIALDLNEPARALPRFDTLLNGRIPVVAIPHARHGRALALYGLKRFAEARDEWMALLSGTAAVPPAIASETNFWLGDTLGRLGDYQGATSRLRAFTTGGSHALMESALLSLGWWSRAAGQPADAEKAYRTYLAAYPQSPTAPWARAGLALALLESDDVAAAREEIKQLESLDRSGALAVPALLTMRRWVAEHGTAEEAQALDADLLARPALDPGARAWVLLLSADLARRSGNTSQARDPLEIVRVAPAPLAVKQQAELALAQVDFDAREFSQAHSAAARLLSQSPPDDVRAAALVVAGESAYWAKDYDAAAEAYERFISDFSSRPEAPLAGLALGWAEFRRGRVEEASERWAAFAREAPADPNAPLALLLTAELAAKRGDFGEARSRLDEVVRQYPSTAQADVARLNLAILAFNTARPQDALAELNRLSNLERLPALNRARIVRGLALIASQRGAAARPELTAALGQGDDALAHLGLGVLAFQDGQWDEAARELAAARDAGWGGIVTAAEYGLAAVAFNRRDADEFKKAAAALVTAAPDAATAPLLLYGLDVVAVDEKRWTDARDVSMRLVNQHPRHAVTPLALAYTGKAAGDAGQWPLAREMYQTLAARYPNEPATQAGRLTLGEALLRTGAAADARRELEVFVASIAPSDTRRARALALLGEAQEASGDRTAAAQTYTQFAAEYPSGKEAPSALLGAGRLLQAEGKWDQAQPLLDRAIAEGDAPIAAEAAYHKGEGLRAAGQYEAAAEAYMTAAYVAPDSPWARRALLGAARAYEAAKQNESAVIVYRKLLASSAVEPELAAAARSGLKTLGAN